MVEVYAADAIDVETEVAVGNIAEVEADIKTTTSSFIYFTNLISNSRTLKKNNN